MFTGPQSACSSRLVVETTLVKLRKSNKSHKKERKNHTYRKTVDFRSVHCVPIIPKKHRFGGSGEHLPAIMRIRRRNTPRFIPRTHLSKQQRTATVPDETKIVPGSLIQNRLKRGYVRRSCTRNQGFVCQMLEKLGTSFCLQVFYSCGSNNTRATETVEEAGLLSGRFHAGCLRFIVVPVV